MDRRSSRIRLPRTIALPLTLALALTWALMAGGLGCGGARPMLRAEMAPLDLAPAPAAQQQLRKDHFQRDHMGTLSEGQLREILDAPVFLEKKARLGVVPVATAYRPDKDLPLTTVPGQLVGAVEDSGFFEVTTEMSTDWPADRGLAGLRELAARYRAEYLLLYRQRFVDRDYTNAWALLWPTFVGIFATPHQTLETAGVVEATLFDVRTGTLLFTVYERVTARSDENVWQNDRKRREMKERLLGDAAGGLAEKVTSQLRRLAAARPAPELQPKAAALKTVDPTPAPEPEADDAAEPTTGQQPTDAAAL